MPNNYPEWRNFPFAPNNHYGFFFLHKLPLTIAFKLEYALFYEFVAKITQYAVKKCSVRLLLMTLTWERLAEIDGWRQNKITSWPHAWGGVRRHFLTLVSDAKFRSGMQEYKTLTWVWGADSKFRPEGLFGSRGFAEWYKTVIPMDGIFYPHWIVMFDSFSCIPSYFERFILKVIFITTHNDVDVGHFLIWRHRDIAVTSR